MGIGEVVEIFGGGEGVEGFGCQDLNINLK